MKVLFVAPANSMHTYKWVDYFNKKGCEIKLISLYNAEKKFTDEFPEINLKVISLTKFKSINFVFAWIYLVYLTTMSRPDVVHGQSAGSHGLLAAFLPTRKLITTVWGSDILIAAQKFYIRPFVKFILFRSRSITCDAQHMIQALLALDVDPDKIKLINFGVDTHRLSKFPCESIHFNEEYRGSLNRKVVISLRNHWPIYDIETLVRAAARVLELRADVNFIVAGRGPETEKYIQLAKNLGVYDNFRFVGGYNGVEIPEMLSSCDAYVSCSLSDAGIAASTAEAMSCTVPVVISDTGENNLWIRDGENGFLFPASNDDILAKKLLLILNDDKLARSIGENGRETIVKNNDYRTEMEKVYKLYLLFQNL